MLLCIHYANHLQALRRVFLGLLSWQGKAGCSPRCRCSPCQGGRCPSQSSADTIVCQHPNSDANEQSRLDVCRVKKKTRHIKISPLTGEGETVLCLVKTCSSKPFPNTPDSPGTLPLTHHFQVAVAGQSKSKDSHLSGSKYGDGGVNGHLSVLPVLFNDFCCIPAWF